MPNPNDLLAAANDNDDTDIPQEAFAVDTPAQDPIAKPVYRWEIPDETHVPYVAVIEITDAADVDEARRAALAIRFGVREATVDTPKDDGRGLTAMERAYIMQTPPVVVRDSEQITLTHAMAIYLNERLTRENEAFAGARRLFEDLGIDPDNPAAWAERQKTEANNIISIAKDAFDMRASQIALSIERAIADLKTAAFQTGFATPEPKPLPEPDYSPLTIFVDDVDKAQQFPRLASATWVERTPGEGLSESEARGAEMLCKEGGYIETAYRGFHNPTDEKALRDIQNRLKAEWGL